MVQLMAKLDVERLRRIKRLSPIEEVIGDYLKIIEVEDFFIATCPFHQDAGTSLRIKPARNSFYCSQCEASGNVFEFIGMIEQVTSEIVISILERRAGLS